MDTVYPWLEPHWQRMQSRLRQQRLPHALLLNGPAGLGKRDFATRLAAGLLCESPLQDGQACGQCPRCRLRLAGTHPDFIQLGPQEGKQAILIDQIRELTARLGQTSHAGGYKAAILAPADAMNTAAANSLLKTLEEPTDNTVIVLVTERPARLPATIRSRCQLLRFQAPPQAQTLDWLRSRVDSDDPQLLLELADGAPLAALELDRSGDVTARGQWLADMLKIQAGQTDPVEIAARWADNPEAAPVQWLGNWVMDMIRLLSDPGCRLRNRDLRSPLEQLARSWTARQLFERLDQIREVLRLLYTPVNRQLLIESLLIDWMKSHRQATTHRSISG